MRISCTRRLTFCAGHRVYGHETKCSRLHGHNWEVHVTVTADKLDKVGRVLDFGTIKKHLQVWLDDNWDHMFLVSEKDEDAIALLKLMEPYSLVVLPVNPTAENLAGHLMGSVFPGLLKGCGVTLTAVRVCETENCWATVERE